MDDGEKCSTVISYSDARIEFISLDHYDISKTRLSESSIYFRIDKEQQIIALTNLCIVHLDYCKLIRPL